jgi:DNA-binding response OmpR family regulator
MRILIADDDEDLADTLAHMLSGHEVQISTNGEDAFNLYCYCLSEGVTFDFVLLGLELPGMDGIALRHAIRDKNPNQAMGWTTGYPVLQRPHDRDALLRFIEEEMS